MDVGALNSISHAPSTPTKSESTDQATMDALIIRGGKRLTGRIEVSGAKNAALPVMAATLLAPGVHTIRNVPLLADTRTMAQVLEKLARKYERLTKRIEELDGTLMDGIAAIVGDEKRAAVDRTRDARAWRATFETSSLNMRSK